MKIGYFSLLIISLALKASSQSPQRLFVQDSLKLISSQFKFTEGPSVNKRGDVFFTDQPNNTIWKFTTDGKLLLYTDKAGRANGTYVDKIGNLIVCADEHNELWIFNDKKESKLLYKNPTALALNGPNDLWIVR
jgi:gluconolactonase